MFRSNYFSDRFLAQKKNYQNHVIHCYSHLGNLYLETEDAKAAYESYISGKKIAELKEMKQELGELTFGLSKAEHMRGDLKAALSWAKESYSNFELIGHPTTKEVGSWILKLQQQMR